MCRDFRERVRELERRRAIEEGERRGEREAEWREGREVCGGRYRVGNSDRDNDVEERRGREREAY